MSHDEGIYKAWLMLDGEAGLDEVEQAIKAYIDASGMVMVPKTPTREMLTYVDEAQWIDVLRVCCNEA